MSDPRLERDAQNWRKIAALVREVDRQSRGEGVGMADDDVLDVVIRYLVRQAKDPKKAARAAYWGGEPPKEAG